MSGFGWIAMLVWWALVVAVIVWLVRAATATRTTPTARQLLDQRFAAGEINAEEYQERRRVLH
jgi:putative membrane protein